MFREAPGSVVPPRARGFCPGLGVAPSDLDDLANYRTIEQSLASSCYAPELEGSWAPGRGRVSAVARRDRWEGTQKRVIELLDAGMAQRTSNASSGGLPGGGGGMWMDEDRLTDAVTEK